MTFCKPLPAPKIPVLLCRPCQKMLSTLGYGFSHHSCSHLGKLQRHVDFILEFFQLLAILTTLGGTATQEPAGPVSWKRRGGLGAGVVGSSLFSLAGLLLPSGACLEPILDTSRVFPVATVLRLLLAGEARGRKAD